jgi:hypothetical protein
VKERIVEQKNKLVLNKTLLMKRKKIRKSFFSNELL